MGNSSKYKGWDIFNNGWHWIGVKAEKELRDVDYVGLLDKIDRAEPQTVEDPKRIIHIGNEPPSMVGYLVYHDDLHGHKGIWLEGRKGAYFNYILAGNGLFIEAQSPLLSGRVLVAGADVRGLPALAPEFHLHHGKIPRYLLDLALGAMLAAPDKERYLCVTYDREYRLRTPIQVGSGISVEYERMDNVVLDLHSHGKMGAFFSGTDDKDEQGLRLYGVVGGIGGVPGSPLRVRMRLGVYGYFNQVELKDVFEDMPGGLIDESVEPVEQAVDESVEPIEPDIVLIPDYDPYTPGQKYPGDIKPGEQDLVKLLREVADNSEAVRFIADMLEK